MNKLPKTSSEKTGHVPTLAKTKSPQRILVVDDEPHIRELNARALAFSGYHVITVEDGALAWDALQHNHYDLLITDHNMPRLTGVELVKKLHAARMAVPVILVTGALPTEELKQHPWLQIDATLLKPFTTDELLGTVRQVLRVTDSVSEQNERPPNWASQPSQNGLQM
jgi:DNA-binding response OmpR family regulator